MENEKRKNIFSSHDVNLLGQGHFVDIFGSTTARWLSYKIIKQEKQLFRVKGISSVSNDHAMVDFRNNSLLWILLQGLQVCRKPHWQIDQQVRDRFERTLKKCEDYPEKLIKTFNGRTRMIKTMSH